MNGRIPVGSFSIKILYYSLIENGPRGKIPNLKPQEKNEFLLNDCARVAAQQSLGGDVFMCTRTLDCEPLLDREYAP